MVQHLWIYLVIPILFFLGWSYTALMLRHSLPALRNKAIVLLIAHPDDEAMFFAPSVLALTRPELGNHVKILCLSNGNADGLGSIRRNEIIASGLRLGLRSQEDVLVLDDPRFPDSMSTTWPTEGISQLLDSFFLKNATTPGSSGGARQRKQGNAREATIDVLLTFDSSGVSSHPNHISLYHGATSWVRSLVQSGSATAATAVALYSLTSVNILRKYSGFLDAPFTLAWNAGGTVSFAKKRSARAGLPARMMFVNDVSQWTQAMGTMVYAHASQMRWFRWGWISLGRYMVVNDLRRVVI